MKTLLTIVGSLAWLIFLIKLLGDLGYRESWIIRVSEGAEIAYSPSPLPFWLMMTLFVMCSTVFVTFLCVTLRACLEPSGYDTHYGYSWQFVGSNTQFRSALNHEVWSKYGNKPTLHEASAGFIGLTSILLLAGLTRPLVWYWLGVALWTLALWLVMVGLALLRDEIEVRLDDIDYGRDNIQKQKWKARLSQLKALTIISLIVLVAYTGISLFNVYIDKSAINSPSNNIKWDVEAVNKLTDQSLLAMIATQKGDEVVRYAAVGRLTDQTLLAEIAANEPHWLVRAFAVEKVTDQALLAKVATSDKVEVVRNEAVKRLADSNLLAKIAVEDSDSSVRSTAAARLERIKQSPYWEWKRGQAGGN